ncbi:uncharacterized protein LOC111592746 [Drosophila hydei]|uniref:Uncharacterized protein LOC111592746 n=1 Tax=Drosophila hydei TaxID=7224 RepID=A0A6J1LCC8_DROHY|nr:uncharacterized protein LOC111592746 [Drosophila hydei]
MKMSLLRRVGLLALLAFLLAPAAFVDATCGYCYGSHTCLSNTTFQLCFNKTPSPDHSFTCPDDKPICTQYGDICMETDVPPACGDTSKCNQCGNGEIYACASLTTFGSCDGGELMPERSTCPNEWFCSIRGASIGTPCVLACEPDVDDTCDRIDNDAVATTPVPNTTPGGSTPNSYCQSTQIVGKFPLANDAVCTSFVYCFFRDNVWNGAIYNCPTNKPYFNAISGCGATRPTGVGCK